MIGRHLLLGLFHHHGATFRPHHDLVLRLFELQHGDHSAALASREEGSLVHQVGQIGTGETRVPRAISAGLTSSASGTFAHVHFQDLLTTANIRQADHDLAVETTWTQQSRIQYVGTVGGGDDDDAFIAFKTIHFNQHLVQGLLTFVVTTTQTGATLATDRIDLINEDDAGEDFLACSNMSRTREAPTPTNISRSPNLKW